MRTKAGARGDRSVVGTQVNFEFELDYLRVQHLESFATKEKLYLAFGKAVRENIGGAVERVRVHVNNAEAFQEVTKEGLMETPPPREPVNVGEMPGFFTSRLD